MTCFKKLSIVAFVLANLTVVSCGRSTPLGQLKSHPRALVLGSTLPPKLVPPGPGAGVWNSEPASFENRVLAKAAPLFLSSQATKDEWGEEAAGTFRHYFDNDGAIYTVDPQRLLAAVPRMETLYSKDLADILSLTSNLSEGHYEFTSAEALQDRVTKAEDNNWYLAVNGFSYYVNGTIDVGADGQKIVTWAWNLWDFYDWDPGVKVPVETPLGPIEIDQDRVGELHRQGLAKEFETVGSIKTVTRIP